MQLEESSLWQLSATPSQLQFVTSELLAGARLLRQYLALNGIGLAGHYGERSFGLTERAWLRIGGAVAALAILIDLTVLEVRPLLPSMVMAPIRVRVPGSTVNTSVACSGACSSCADGVTVAWR